MGTGVDYDGYRGRAARGRLGRLMPGRFTEREPRQEARGRDSSASDAALDGPRTTADTNLTYYLLVIKVPAPGF